MKKHPNTLHWDDKTSSAVFTYNEVEITYNEHENLWEFTLRGRERTASSLKLAKEAIDKPAPASEGPKFAQVKGWLIKYGYKPETATLTGIARERYGTARGRFTSGGRSGQVEDLRNFFPFTEANAVLIDRINQLNEVIEQKRTERNEVQAKLTKYTTV